MSFIIFPALVACVVGVLLALRGQRVVEHRRQPQPMPCPYPVPVALKDQPFDLVLGGRLVGPFILSEEAIQSRMAVLGASGSGKSKFLFLLFASLIAARKGFLLIDPHGDLAHALLAWCKSRIDKGDTWLLKRLHFLEPSRRAFCLDPFASIPKGLAPYRYERRLKAKVDRIRRNLMRRVSEADQDVMLRLKRWMENILWACGVRDASDNHVGLHKALVFTDPTHPEFGALYARVAPFLPDHVRQDFEKLIATKRPLDQEKWLESSINRFRDILSPLTLAMFAPRPGGEAFRMGEVIRQGGFVIASLGENNEFSHDEKQVIGGLLIDEVLTAKMAEEDLPEEKRAPFVLGIDEFGEFLGEDLLRAFGAVRKYKLSIVVAGQDLSTLEKGELDLAAKVLSQCQTKMIFNMTWPDDLAILARNIGYGNIDFTELVHEIDRHGGYDYFRVLDPSFSVQQGSSRGKGGAQAKGAGGSRTTSHADGGQESWGQANGAVVTAGDTTSDAEADQASVGRGRGEALDIRDGLLMNRFPTFNANEGRAHTSQRSHARQSSVADSVVVNSGGGRNWSDGTADAANWNTVDTANWTESDSDGQGLTLAYKLMTLAKIVREKQRTGQLEMSVADQFERLKQQIHGLRPRFCLVKLPDEPKAFLAEVAAVREFYATPTARQRAIQAVKEQLAVLRRYYVEDEAEEMMAPTMEAPLTASDEADQENPIA